MIVEYYDKAAGAVMRLRWMPPGETQYNAVPAARLVPAATQVGNGLSGSYFNNTTLSGNPALTRIEAVNFDWGTSAPGTGVVANNFSVRWTGTLLASTSGAYRFQTVSDDGVRVWVNGVPLIDNWSDHASTTNTSAAINLSAGQRYSVKVEYYDKSGGAVMRLRWLRPGTSAYVAVPSASLFPN